jgi:hypothetical protein
LFVVPAVNDGANCPVGHSEPFGPEVMENGSEGVRDAVPLHGVSEDLIS